MTQYFTTSDGLRLAYHDQGTGPALLCLSGLTRNSSDFNYLAPHLSNVRLIRLDYRGRGQSDHAPDFMSYSIPIEARDAVELLDHLGIKKAAILGTSRGGLIAMALAATVKHRLTGICLNDIGPEIAPDGLDYIMGYLGKPPPYETFAQAAAARPGLIPGFANVPPERWLDEVSRLYRQTDTGLALTYDPKLRDAIQAVGSQPVLDLWPFFDLFADLPLALIRGGNSNLLTSDTAAEMQRRRPDMLFANVPDRGHVPYLDEAESLAVIHDFIESLP